MAKSKFHTDRNNPYSRVRKEYAVRHQPTGLWYNRWSRGGMEDWTPGMYLDVQSNQKPVKVWQSVKAARAVVDAFNANKAKHGEDKYPGTAEIVEFEVSMIETGIVE